MTESASDYFKKKDQKKIDSLLLAFETLSHINQAVFIARKKNNDLEIIFENEFALDDIAKTAFNKIIHEHPNIPKHTFGEINLYQDDFQFSFAYRLFLIPSLESSEEITFSCILENITDFNSELKIRENKNNFINAKLKISNLCSGKGLKSEVLPQIVSILEETTGSREIEYWDTLERNLFDTTSDTSKNQNWYCVASNHKSDLERRKKFREFDLYYDANYPIQIQKNSGLNTFNLVFFLRKSSQLNAILKISNLSIDWHPDQIDWHSLFFILESYLEKIQNLKYLSIYQEMFFQSHEANLVISYESNKKSRSRIESVNDAFLNLTGYTRKELIGKHTGILFGAQTESELLERIQKSIEAGENIFSEITGYKKNGNSFEAKLTLSIIREKNEDSNFIFINLVDISAQKKMEDSIAKRMLFEIGVSSATQTLNDPNPNQDTLAQAMHDFLFFSDMDSVSLLEYRYDYDLPKYDFLFLEKKDRSLLGNYDLIGQQTWADLRLNRWDENLKKGESLNLNATTCDSAEIWYFQKEIKNTLLLPIFINRNYFGVLVWERRTESLLDEEEFLLFKTVSSWVSNYLERTQIFQELNLHKEHLEELIIERTKDLIEAKEKAESANRLKSDFLALMSHELRTPLNSIIGFTKLIHIPDFDETGKKYLTYIHKSGLNLLRMINDLLELSKIDAGKIQIQLELLHPYEIVLNCKENLTPQANESYVTIEIDSNHLESFQVVCDKKLLYQILQNLVSNAVKFSKRNSLVRVEMKTEANRLLILVKDQGEGIKQEDIPHLFESFRRFSINREVGGTGLGLAISKKFAHLLKGEIYVESEFGKGSTFTLSLPIEANATISKNY